MSRLGTKFKVTGENYVFSEEMGLVNEALCAVMIQKGTFMYILHHSIIIVYGQFIHYIFPWGFIFGFEKKPDDSLH